MKKFILGIIALMLVLTGAGATAVKAQTAEETKEKLIMMYWELYARHKAASADLNTYKQYYATTYTLAMREYTDVPSARIIKVTTSSTSSSADCSSCAPFLDISWRATNLPAVRLDLISATTSNTINLATSTPNDGKETIRLNIPANQPSGQYYLVISAAAGNLSTTGKTIKPILTLKGGVATIAPYTLKPSFKLVTPAKMDNPLDLRADADAAYKAANPDKGTATKKKTTPATKEKEDDECSTTDKLLKKPGCLPF